MSRTEAFWRSKLVAERFIHPFKDPYADMLNCPELRGIPSERYPQTVVIIPDGNRRYAKSLHRPTEDGHQAGANKVVELLDAFADLPVRSVIIWGFSSDNWRRDSKEVDAIMKIMDATAKAVLPNLMERNGKLIHLGRKDRIPSYLLHTIVDAEAKTKSNSGQIVGLAVDFSGEDQEERILQNGRVYTNRTREQLKDGAGIIKPADLLLRTGEEDDGLVHTSGIGWLDGAPTMIWTTPKSFPLLKRRDVAKAIRNYASRQRRLGA